MKNKDDLRYRMSMSPRTLDSVSRTLDMVISTESPVKMYDWETGDMVPEVLLAKGAVVPKQVPLLDTHSRDSTTDVYGSVRDIRIEEGGVLVGTARFSNTAKADETFVKFQEGHLTDFSAGYRNNDVTRVRKGEKVSIDGRTWTGPVNVVTSWTLKEVSCCPIGADGNAKARTQQTTMNTKESEEDMSEVQETNDKVAALTESMEVLRSALLSMVDENKKRQQKEVELESQEDSIKKIRIESVRSKEKDIVGERDRVLSINEMTEKLAQTTGIDFEDLRVELIMGGIGKEESYKRCVDRTTSSGPVNHTTFGIRARVTNEERDKSRNSAVDGLMLRAGIATDNVSDKDTEYQTMSMLELAKNRCLVANQPIRGLDQMAIFQRALSTSDFSNILADVANKALQEGFENAQETYQLWADTTGRVNDFKPHVFARASEAPNLVEVNPDGGEYTYGKMTDAKETVAVVDYGIIVPFTRASMVNDDLGALTDIREKLGAASRRKYGDLAYGVLTGNPTMGDGKALFHDDHANQKASGGAAPSVSSLNGMAAAMATQKDLQGVQNLNIIPQFILAPWAYKGTVDNLLVNTNPVQVLAATDTAASVNPWAYLTRIYEARLDAAGVKKWYLAARRGMTVKLFTLNGQMTPVIESQSGWSVDGMEFKARITAAAKAVDYRGLYFNNGE